MNHGGDKNSKGSEHSCGDTGYTCATGHGCGISAAPSAPNLLRMVANGDLTGLRALLPDQNFVYVPERGAVQIVADCGVTVAQLPIAAANAAEMFEH